MAARQGSSQLDARPACLPGTAISLEDFHMSANTGKQIRLNRLIQAETNTCLICAIDHGMTSPQFLDGL